MDPYSVRHRCRVIKDTPSEIAKSPSNFSCASASSVSKKLNLERHINLSRKTETQSLNVLHAANIDGPVPADEYKHNSIRRAFLRAQSAHFRKGGEDKIEVRQSAKFNKEKICDQAQCATSILWLRGLMWFSKSCR